MSNKSLSTLVVGFMTGLLISCPSAYADVILDTQDMPEDSIVNDFSMFDGVLFESNGPFDLGDGVTWSAETDGWIGDMAFGLRDNGYWDWDRVGYVALNTSYSSMLFTFDDPVESVGGYVNYAPLEGFGPMPLIEAFDEDGHLLETYTMDVYTPGLRNNGQFMGFSRDEADIYSFRFTARYGVLDDLTYSGSLVPGPSTMALLALAGLSWFGHRRQRPIRN